jgi:AcrR family transcriptional regulator
MSPRHSNAAAAATRESIVHEAVQRASREGLEALTIGTLAADLEMSKAGVIGPFGSKEALQLAAIEAGNETFRREVWEPAAEREPGLERLTAICNAWLGHLSGGVFPGGCFMTAAAAEFDGRPGPVRDAVDNTLALWLRVLAREARTAVRNGELPAGTDPRQVAFELNSIAMGVNQGLQLRSDPQAVRHGRRAMERVLAPASAD